MFEVKFLSDNSLLSLNLNPALAGNGAPKGAPGTGEPVRWWEDEATYRDVVDSQANSAVVFAARGQISLDSRPLFRTEGAFFRYAASRAYPTQ